MTNKPAISPDSLSQVTYYTAIIDARRERTTRTTRQRVIIDRIKLNNNWQKFGEKAVLYISENTNVNYAYGERILIKGHPIFLEHQMNPQAFDYARYLQRKGVYLQDFVSAHEVRGLGKLPFSRFIYFHLYIGDHFEGVLAKYIISEDALNLTKAMAIGMRNEVSSTMEHVYQTTGTSHILAVSGLHVGIIYWVFSLMFKFLKNRRYSWIYYLIVLCSIWFFALLTGLSPSVRRASLMFTFVLAAEFLGRRNSIYNTILASAFFILLFSPNLLFSVSFQLSYTAVFGIVYLYRKIYVLILFHNKVVDFFWQITSLSISVQIATVPITIYYFNYFPTLSLLTNLIAIPTAIIVICGSLMLFGSSFIAEIPDVLGHLLEIAINFYNHIMIFLSEFEFAAVEGIYLKPFYVFIIMMMTFLFTRFLETKRLILFKYFSMLAVLCLGIVWYDLFTRSYQKEIIFYQVKDKFYFDVFLGRNCFTNIKSTGTFNGDIHYNIYPYRRHSLIANVESLENLESCRKIGKNLLISFNNKSLLILNELTSLSDANANVTVDFLVVGKFAVPYLSELKLNFHNLILDSTINAEMYEGITSLIDDRSEIHFITRNGPYIIRI